MVFSKAPVLFHRCLPRIFRSSPAYLLLERPVFLLCRFRTHSSFLFQNDYLGRSGCRLSYDNLHALFGNHRTISVKNLYRSKKTPRLPGKGNGAVRTPIRPVIVFRISQHDLTKIEPTTPNGSGLFFCQQINKCTKQCSKFIT